MFALMFIVTHFKRNSIVTATYGVTYKDGVLDWTLDVFDSYTAYNS
jgi:hypothetical protein